MNKKKVIIALTILMSLIVTISISVYKTNVVKQEEAQKKKDEKYLKAAVDFYFRAESFDFIASSQLSTYSTTWSSAIDNQEDFSLAVNTKIIESAEILEGLDSIHDKMGKNLKIISKAAQEQPNKYEEAYEEYKEWYSILTAIHEQTQAPSGSLMSFNQNVNSLQQEYTKTKGNIEIAIPSDVAEEIEKRNKKIEKELDRISNKDL